MSAFQLCCCSRERGGLEFTLQSVDEELLRAPGLELEWQHYEMMIWRVKLSSRGLSTLLLAQQHQDRSAKVYEFYGRFLSLLPDHRIGWRLLLMRRCHDANKWRLLCQRINY
ncbi:hypothetical protein [uncultured Pseudoteredinibacter sp.]|uniref:hypothetical protein n=1 Tax=uncultured Pseudoteredinibacter sp. TaxID=1641701 RepID=UPI002614BDF0|nr:hypothetical protein [uncultured Pseudoteredinibacter sp.]